MRAPTRRLAGVVAAAATLALAVPAIASANTYCASVPADCPGGSVAETTVQGALDAANANGAGTRDQVVVPSGGFSAVNAVDVAGNAVDIVGAGTTRTTVSGSGGGGVTLTVSEPTSTVSDITLVAVASSGRALDLTGSAERLAVRGSSGTNSEEGIRVIGAGATIRDSNVQMQATAAGWGIRVVTSGLAAATTIQDVLSSGFFGIESDSAGNVSLQRAQLVGVASLSVQSGTMNAQDVVADVNSSSGVGVLANASGTQNVAVTARHVTVFAENRPSTVGFESDGTGSHAASLTIGDSLVRGASTDLKRDASGGGEASLAIDYSDLDQAKVSDSGPGSLSQGSHDLNADPRLVNEAGGNFRLRSDSPLVDAGDPAAPAAGDSATDLDGSPRVVDGTGDCSARRDIGAFEFQPGPRAPRAVATAPAKATGSVSFDASASCDPDGNPLAYLWSFDDGQTAAGPVVTHEFATGGRHTGTVTVTDSTGRTDTATASVAFARADHTAPVIHASITRKDFKVGKAATKFRFSLSEKAAVAVKLRQKRGKHLVTRGTLHHAGARGKNSLPFSGRVGGRALAPGSYEAVFTATDAAGNKSKRASVAFRIKNKR